MTTAGIVVTVMQVSTWCTLVPRRKLRREAVVTSRATSSRLPFLERLVMCSRRLLRLWKQGRSLLGTFCMELWMSVREKVIRGSIVCCTLRPLCPTWQTTLVLSACLVSNMDLLSLLTLCVILLVMVKHLLMAVLTTVRVMVAGLNVRKLGLDLSSWWTLATLFSGLQCMATMKRLVRKTVTRLALMLEAPLQQESSPTTMNVEWLSSLIPGCRWRPVVLLIRNRLRLNIDRTRSSLVSEGLNKLIYMNWFCLPCVRLHSLASVLCRLWVLSGTLLASLECRLLPTRRLLRHEFTL